MTGACDRVVHETQAACRDRDFSVVTDWFNDQNRKKKKMTPGNWGVTVYHKYNELIAQLKVVGGHLDRKERRS